jgi:hypothetical protein
VADDLTDAEQKVQAMQGIENSPTGFVLLRAVRLLRQAVIRLKALEDRVTTLEGK